MKKKTIGIMSMQRILNYGSFLQAYGLKKNIEELGYNVKFCDYKIEPPVISSPMSKPLKKFLKKVGRNLNLPEYLGMRSFKKKFSAMYKKSIGQYFDLTEERQYLYANIDELVIGSDEVFNCLQGYPVGYSKELFGKNYENIPVISYAACFGNANLEDLKKYNIQDEIKDMLLNFKKISVRDENSFNIVRTLTGTSPEVNLDPVLITDFKDEMIDSVDLKNYILIYAYNRRLTSDEQKIIKKFAKKHNKKIVALGGYQKVANCTPVPSPFEVFGYFKHADYVITDTFHGSIFSIKNHAKFCTIVRKGSLGNNNKVQDLLERLNLQSRIAHNIEEIESLYHSEINYESTDTIIESETKKSIKYLKENLV